MPKANPHAHVVMILRRHYGRPQRPVSRDPFRLVLWEQVAYLVPDAERRRAFHALRIRDQKDYRTTYRRAQEVLAPLLPEDADDLIVAYHLLRRHGQTLVEEPSRLAPNALFG